jgi:ubiquitin carboxyl-terminal hydrolase 48
MLIYSRRKNPVDGDQSPGLEIPTPPARALDVVNKLNADHDEACEKYEERCSRYICYEAPGTKLNSLREKEVLRKFEEVRQDVMQIYRSWDISSPKDVCDSALMISRTSSTWFPGLRRRLPGCIGSLAFCGIHCFLTSN